MDSFTKMVDTAQAFFAELAAANTREWFEPRKAHYASAIRKPSELFAEVVSDELSSLTGVRHDAKLFRIYRDVRFSKDKRLTIVGSTFFGQRGTDPSPPSSFPALRESYA